MYDLNRPVFGRQWAAWAPTSYTNQQWHHLVGIYKNYDWYLYVDNILAGYSDYSELTTSTGNLVIGRNFEGLIDDVRFYDRAINEMEIDSLYKLPGFCCMPTLESYCLDIIVTLDDFGLAYLSSSDVLNNSSAGCTVDSITLSPNSFNCLNLGENMINLIVMDLEGNIDSCELLVTVLDEIVFSDTCQDLTVYLDTAGIAKISVDQVYLDITSNCSSGEISNLSLSDSLFDCSNVAEQANPQNIILTIVDTAGYSSTCLSAVTLQDTIIPFVVCQDITISLDSSNLACISVADINIGSYDNCAIDTMFLSKTCFDSLHIGANTLTLTVVDNNDNLDSCQVSVLVNEIFAPVASCKDITISIDDSGMAVITAQDIDNGSSDNHIIDTIIISQTDYDCTNLGENMIYLIVQDVSGNVDSCMAMVTIQDSLPPILQYDGLTVYLNEEGIANIWDAQIENVIIDNCTPGNDLIMSVTDSLFYCEDIVEPILITLWDNVGTPGFSDGRGDFPDLEFYNDEPYVAFCDNHYNNKMTVMKYNGSNWVNVGNPGFSEGSTDGHCLSFNNGEPYIAFRDVFNDRKMTVMKYDGSSWVSVGNPGFSEDLARNPSLTFFNDEPYVGYQDWANSNKMTVMKYNGNSWESVGIQGFYARVCC